MPDINLFPSTIAIGSSFCNREQERELLKLNINENRHGLIVSPRRYGKTSLINKVLLDNNFIFAYAHFFSAYQDDIIIHRLTHSISRLVSQLMPFSQKALKKLSALMTHCKISAKISGAELAFELEPINKHPREIITGLFEDLGKLLKSTKKKVVLFFDEFQDVGDADISDEFQAILRDFCQFNKNVTLIVSGSHRHMLENMLDSSQQPFYKFFDKINLKRISEKSYKSFLNKLAKKNWKKTFTDESFNEIIILTECHSYYFNKLCSALWRLKNIPDIHAVQQCWQQLYLNEASGLATDLMLLTKNQRILLQGIAMQNRVIAPQSKDFLSAINLAQSSATQALAVLIKKDFIEETNEGYRLIDPLMKYMLSHGETELDALT